LKQRGVTFTLCGECNEESIIKLSETEANL